MWLKVFSLNSRLLPTKLVITLVCNMILAQEVHLIKNFHLQDNSVPGLVDTWITNQTLIGGQLVVLRIIQGIIPRSVHGALHLVSQSCTQFSFIRLLYYK